MQKKIIITFYLCFLASLIFGGGNMEEAKEATKPANARIASTSGNGYYTGNNFTLDWDAAPATYRYATGNIFNPNIDITLARYEISTMNTATQAKTITAIPQSRTTGSIHLASGTYWIFLQSVYKNDNDTEWYSFSVEYFDIAIDSDLPTVPEIPAVTLQPSADFYVTAHGMLYTKSSAVTLTWSGASDRLSGIKKYEYGITGDLKSATTTTGVYTFPAEGSYAFKVRAVDKAGNAGSYTNTKTVFHDASAPAAVNDITADITASGYILQKLRIGWNGNTQDNPANGAGVTGYDISVKAADTAHGADNPALIGSNSYELDLTSLTRGTECWVAVRAVDYLDQAGSWNEVSVMIPPALMQVTGAGCEPGIVLAGAPVYPLQLEICAPAGETTGDYLANKIKGIKLYAYDSKGETLLVSAAGQEILTAAAGEAGPG